MPDEILVVNNASTDETRAAALQIPYVQVVDEPRKGLVVARETAAAPPPATSWSICCATAAGMARW